MKLNKVSMHSNLYGLVSQGQFVAFPDYYLDRKDEVRNLTETVSDCAKEMLGSGHLNKNFICALEKYGDFLEQEKTKTPFESFFTKIGAFAIALTNSDIIVDTDEKYTLNKRGNILVAASFALKAFENPNIISNKDVSKLDLSVIYPLVSQKNSIYLDLCKTLSHNNQRKEEFVIKVMSYYLEAYNILNSKKIKKGLIPFSQK